VTSRCPAKAPEKLYAVAGDERLLAPLRRGNWVGGTIPYLMTDEEGGLTTRDRLLVQELPRTSVPRNPTDSCLVTGRLAFLASVSTTSLPCWWKRD
jgi:hypothetical protein